MSIVLYWFGLDSDLSQDFPRLPFLHTGHPLVLAAVDELQGDAPPDWIARLGSFALPPLAVDARTRSGPVLAIYRSACAA